MAECFIGEIRMFAGLFAPQDWAFCDGQLISVAENDALFSLIGSTYGGDGQTTFGLPDLRGRLPVHYGTGTGLPDYQLAVKAGAEEITLTANQLGSHNHAFQASANLGTDVDPTNHTFARVTAGDIYSSDAAQPLTAMSARAVGPSAGGGGPHSNIMPFLCVNFIIALFGIFPSRD